MPNVIPIPAGANIQYVFSIDNVIQRNIVLRNGLAPPNGPAPPIFNDPLNTQTLSIVDLTGRYFSDMVKDSQTEVKVNNVIQKLNDCFGHNPNIPPNIADYKRRLQQYDDRVATAYTSNITIFKNILKTSTVGSNIQISDAEYALWESGLGCNSVCRNRNMKTVKTSAATLDSLLKQRYDLLFNPFVTFDETFSEYLGIPGGLRWQTSPDLPNTQKSNVNIQFWTPAAAQAAAQAVRNSQIDNELNTPGSRGDFNGIDGGNGDIMGNDLKNTKINSLTAPEGCPQMKRLFIIKEIGDVAQVWMYLAFILIMGYSRTQVVMVTTDSVVYLFCILLKLSCIYTGERVGVQSGCCTLKHYLGGDPDYLQKYNNMVEVHANRIIQHNNSIALGLKILVQDPSMFDYYIQYGGGVRRTVASKGLTLELQRTRVNPMVRGFILIIEATIQFIKLALELVKTTIALAVAQAAAAQAAVAQLLDAVQAARAAAEEAQRAAFAGVTLPQEAEIVGQAAVEANQLLQRAQQTLNDVLVNTNAVITAAANQEQTITAGYNHFCEVIDTLKQANMLTLLPNKRYIMLPNGLLLQQFINVTNPVATLVPNVDSIIAGAQAAAAAALAQNRAMRGGSEEGGVAKKQRSDTGGAYGNILTASFDADDVADYVADEDTSTFYECLIACYIQDSSTVIDGNHIFGVLDTIHDVNTLKNNPLCSIEHFDGVIKGRATVDDTGFSQFDFNDLYQYQTKMETREVNMTYRDPLYELQIAFALKYDDFVNKLISEENLNFNLDGTTPNRVMLQNYVNQLYPLIPDPINRPDNDTDLPVRNISESQIIKRGKKLLRFLHLAEDAPIEDLSLKATIVSREKIFGLPPGIPIDLTIYPDPVDIDDWIIDTKFHSWMLHTFRGGERVNVPSFVPSTMCGRKYDPIWYNIIDPALAIEITLQDARVDERTTVKSIKKCYQVTTIVDYLINNPTITLETLVDLSTRGRIEDRVKQNIANFIIMMYRLTPIVRATLGRFLPPRISSDYDRYLRTVQQPATRRRAAGDMGGGSKRKTIRYKPKYKNKSKNHKRINKHRITRRYKTKTRRSTRKHSRQ